jgi:hypothetical protein
MRVVLASCSSVQKAVSMRASDRTPIYANPRHAQRYEHLLLMHEALLQLGLAWRPPHGDDTGEYVPIEQLQVEAGQRSNLTPATAPVPVVGVMDLCTRIS